MLGTAVEQWSWSVGARRHEAAFLAASRAFAAWQLGVVLAQSARRDDILWNAACAWRWVVGSRLSHTGLQGRRAAGESPGAFPAAAAPLRALDLPACCRERRLLAAGLEGLRREVRAERAAAEGGLWEAAEKHHARRLLSCTFSALREAAHEREER